MIEYLPVNKQGNYTLLSDCRNYVKAEKNAGNILKFTIN
jgi:hypothetical protein